MITSVRFQNFKALQKAEIELSRLTMLLGPNASGKTSVLTGLHLLTRLASADARAVFQGSAEIGLLASRGAEGALELELTSSFQDKQGSLAVRFPTLSDYPFSSTFSLESRWADKERTVTGELLGDEPLGVAPADLPLHGLLREAMYLALDAKRLAAPAFSEQPSPSLASDGGGLAAVIADMAAARPNDLLRLQDAAREVVPGLEEVRLIRARVDEGWGHEIVLDMKGARDIPARSASEGTLLVIGLFAALMGPGRHPLVLVDHLDRCVGPRSAGPLIRHLGELLAADPELQIVATCDAPHLADHLAPEEVRIHAVLPDGSAAAAPLVQHPDFNLLRRDLRPGELWTTVGDAWVDAARHAVTAPAELPAPTGRPVRIGSIVGGPSRQRRR